MQYLAMFAIMAMLGAGAGGTALMAADFGYGAPDDVQAQNRWTGPADFGYGPEECTGECEQVRNQNRNQFGEGPCDDTGERHRFGPDPGNDTGHRFGESEMADHDGDGIPNGLDPDWVRPEDGSGYQHRRGRP